MNLIRTLAFFAVAAAAVPALSQSNVPAPTANDTIVLRGGTFALTKSEYEKLVPGFDRAAGAVPTGVGPQSMQSGHDIAQILALVSEAQRRKIDQDPKMQAIIQVRGYVLLVNSLLLALIDDMKKDEAGTRALWESEKHNYVEVQARQILVRYQGVRTEKAGQKGTSRTEAQAKAVAADLAKKLQQGADFRATAKASSDDEATRNKGGELPAFSRGAMVPEFEIVAFDTPVGGVSQPFKSKYGYHIVQVVERRPFAFERVRPALENIRAKQKYEEIASAGIQLNDAYFKP